MTFYRLNATLAFSGAQAGPNVHLSAIVLGIDETTPDSKGRMTTKLLSKADSLYPWQINGVVDMFLKTLGVTLNRTSNTFPQDAVEIQPVELSGYRRVVNAQGV